MNEFTERQYFRQWWVWLLLIAALVVPTVLSLNTMGVENIRKGDNLSALLYGAGLPASICVLFYFLRLDTRVTRQGVQYRFFPFQINMKTAEWGELNKAYVRQYNPLGEYGVWGIRFGFGKTGMAYNVSGNMGLQLERTNGKRILIGTNNPTALAAFLETLVKERVIDRKLIVP